MGTDVSVPFLISNGDQMSEVEVAHEARLAESKQYHDQQKKKLQKPKKENVVYELVGDKVVKKVRDDHGNVYSTYMGKKAQYGHLLSK